MRRIQKNKKDGKVQEEALKQFRALRARIESQKPDLLGDLRDQLFADEKETIDTARKSDLVIDRKKNMATVLKVLELKNGSDSFKKELAKLL